MEPSDGKEPCSSGDRACIDTESQSVLFSARSDPLLDGQGTSLDKLGLPLPYPMLRVLPGLWQLLSKNSEEEHHII